jgi:ubiquinol-cytochrome c reductase cytochrome b subunit
MRLWDWFDERTGVRRLVHVALEEAIPGGARWRYVWGSTLVFLFAVQAFTGVLLMTIYSPSATTAWSSVWYIQTQATGGWLVRGIHHFGSQAFTVLMPIHVLQVVFARAYRAPREVNWWLGLGLLGTVLALALTGYLLPWDQKGYWATKVATNIMGLTPVIGESLQRLVVGGSQYGHLTLTRFFTLHVMVLPGVFTLLLAGHLALFRRHGVTVSPRLAARGTGRFWPEQLAMDSVACLGVLGLLIAMSWYTHGVIGSPLLDAPADPAASDYPARPEWYFLFLFQMLKYFEGPWEVVGATVVPGVVAGVFFLLPLLDRALPSRLAHGVATGFTLLVLAGIVGLTYAAIRDDRDPSGGAVAAVVERQRVGEELSPSDSAVLRSRQFNDQRREAERVAARALVLAARDGIPPEGPLTLLRNDPVLQGPMLFARHCAACHRYDGHDGRGWVPSEPPKSSDLHGYATRAWLGGFLADPQGEGYFGHMKLEDGDPAHTYMTDFLDELRVQYEDEGREAELQADLDAAAAYLHSEARSPGHLAHVSAEAMEEAVVEAGPPRGDDWAMVVRGRAVFNRTCNECHSYGGERRGTTKAPEMRGYGSPDWIAKMIEDPAADDLYRSRGRERALMPSFRDRLTENERFLLARWLYMNGAGAEEGAAAESDGAADDPAADDGSVEVVP